jgi:hypothetical protein
MAQSAVVQHVVAEMQLFDAEQSFVVVGQLQLPPGALQIALPTVQSAEVQHAAIAMQLDDAPHARWPAGQAQAPPGPLHI